MILAELKVLLTTDINKYQANMSKAAKIADRTGKQLAKVGKALTVGVTLPLAAMGAASVKAASDLGESMNKVQVVFGDSAKVVQDFSKVSARSLGISQRAALEAAGTFGNLFAAMGLGQQASAEMSVSLVQLAADLASFNNLDPSEVLEKLRSGLVGEVEPLRALGVQLDQASVKAKAMELGLAGANGEISQAALVQARYALILEQTQTAQGDFARTADGLANSMRVLNARWEDARAKLGQQLLPIAIKGVGVINDLLDAFNGMPDASRRTAIQIGAVAAAMGPTLVVVGKLTSGLAQLSGAIRAAGGAMAFLKAMTVGTLIPLSVAALALADLAGVVAVVAKAYKLAKDGTERVRRALEQHERTVRLTAGSYGEYVSEMLRAEVVAGKLSKQEAARYKYLLLTGQAQELVIDGLTIVSRETFSAAQGARAAALAYDKWTRVMPTAIGYVEDLSAVQGKLADTAGKTAEKMSAWRVELGKVTEAMLAQRAIDALNQAFDDGLIGIGSYVSGLREVMTNWLHMPQNQINANLALANLDAQLKAGIITWQEYIDQVRTLRRNLDNIPREISVHVGIQTTGGLSGLSPIPQAHGGDWLVTRPTLFLAGEAGPERATFTPLRGGASPAKPNINININANVADDIDIQRLAWRVADALAEVM